MMVQERTGKRESMMLIEKVGVRKVQKKNCMTEGSIETAEEKDERLM